MNKIITFLCLSLVAFNLKAQVEMADNFRGEGKIYVVLGIILLILSGFIIMLFRLDKKAKRIEKEIEEK